MNICISYNSFLIALDESLLTRFLEPDPHHPTAVTDHFKPTSEES